MNMLQTLRELYAHQEWADAEHWRAILGCAPAREDQALRERLHHVHVAQHAFYAMTSGTRFASTKPEDFPRLLDLRAYARDYYPLAAGLLQTMDESGLDADVKVPWFKSERPFISRGQALLQCTMHSLYHRGQNATRLRELGGNPPLTDLIAWYWKQRPAASWD